MQSKLSSVWLIDRLGNRVASANRPSMLCAHTRLTIDWDLIPLHCQITKVSQVSRGKTNIARCRGTLCRNWLAKVSHSVHALASGIHNRDGRQFVPLATTVNQQALCAISFTS